MIFCYVFIVYIICTSVEVTIFWSLLELHIPFP